MSASAIDRLPTIMYRASSQSYASASHSEGRPPRVAHINRCCTLGWGETFLDGGCMELYTVSAVARPAFQVTSNASSPRAARV
jgi:hypothetical protein